MKQKLHAAIAKLMLPQDTANHFVLACAICTAGTALHSLAAGALAVVVLAAAKEVFIDTTPSWPDFIASVFGILPVAAGKYL